MSVGTRNGRIDLMRGVAILLVLLHHFDIPYHFGRSPLGALLGRDLVHAVCRNGNYGVTMFFAISGFLITNNALNRWGRFDRVPPVRFYALRAARILPCLLLLLAMVNLLGASGIPIFENQGGGGDPAPSMIVGDLAALTFWMNVLMAHAGWFNYCLCVLWSLSVEETFYLSFPLLCVLLRREGRIVAVWLLAILIGPIWRATHMADENQFLYASLACFDGIAFGCCAALLSRRRDMLERLGATAWTLLQGATVAGMAALYLSRSIGVTAVWGVSAMALGTSLLLVAATRPLLGAAGSGAGLFRLLGWIGRQSYELYLVHLPVLAALRIACPPAAMPPVGKLPRLLAYLILSAGVAAALARFYAEPLNRLLRARLPASHRERVQTATTVS